MTRFAPSPTGYLHLGHVRSALEGWRAARDAGGRFLLRLEDIDRTRCREEYAAAILEDLAWLGLDWDGAVRRQSEHFDDYRAALARLDGLGVLYPCFCTRREIQAEIARAGGAPQGEAGPVYPGTCRRLGPVERAQRQGAGLDYALRLDVARALALTGPLDWIEEGGGAPGGFRPIRRGSAMSCWRARRCRRAITSRSRSTTRSRASPWSPAARTSAPSTHVHRLLQALLGLPTPRYRHHPLLTDATGRRLAKRDHALTIRAMRAAGASPDEILVFAGYRGQSAAAPDLAHRTVGGAPGAGGPP